MGTFHLTAGHTIVQQMVQYCLQWLPPELNVGARPHTWDITPVEGRTASDHPSYRVTVKLSNGKVVEATCEVTRDRTSFTAGKCQLLIGTEGEPAARRNLLLSLSGDRFMVTG